MDIGTKGLGIFVFITGIAMLFFNETKLIATVVIGFGIGMMSRRS